MQPNQHDLLNRDLYEVLGVEPDADADELQRAYRALAREHHPDVNPDDPEAEDRFKAITEAYDILSNDEKRAEYDQFRQMVGNGFDGRGFQAGGFGAPGFGGGFDDLHIRFGPEGPPAGFEDILSQFFARGDGGPIPQRGADLLAALTIGFEAAIDGASISLEVPSEEGARPVTVRLPAGVADGQRVRLPGLGGPGHDGGPAGDLLVDVTVSNHPVFGRRGDDLTVEIPVTYPEAVLGAKIEVPTLRGDRVTIRVPAGTPNGRTLRVKGHGATPDGSLLVTIAVDVPTELTDEQRAAVEALAETVPPETIRRSPKR